MVRDQGLPRVLCVDVAQAMRSRELKNNAGDTWHGWFGWDVGISQY